MTAKPKRSQLKSALAKAVEAGDESRIREIAALDPTLINAGNSHGNTPLLAAVGGQSIETTRLLLELGADPRQANHGGGGPLDGAALSGGREIAELLIAHGAKATALHAAGIGDLERLGGFVEADDRSLGLHTIGGRRTFSPLHAAVMAGQTPVAEWLIARGAEVGCRNHNGHTPLALITDCTAGTRPALAALLLTNGADPNALAGHFGGTILHEAVKARDRELARTLLHHGADPNPRDMAGKTPLHQAVAGNAKEIVVLLLEYQPDLRIETRKHVQQRGGETALDYARNRN